MSQKLVNKKSFDKYYYYKLAVQSPDNDVEFLRDTFKELRGKNATTLCEDFCGTFSICCEWAKLDSSHRAIGVDLDPEPITYGKENYLTKLSEEQQSRVEVINSNVLSPELPKADMIAGMNFSYYLFKKRNDLKAYIQSCYDRLEDDGIVLLDNFGGSECMSPVEEESELEGFTYYWDQDKYDPVSNEALFYIHFKPDGGKKREKVFTYDWRMWSIPEVRELMEEVGFKTTYVYWEGSDEDGEGNGEFTRVEEGEDCEAWVAYIVGLK